MIRHLSELGEIQLLSEVIFQHVNFSSNDISDDCAHLDTGNGSLLWSIDPCPTPVAQWLNISSPEILGWYTAVINLSDIASCGGTPIGMLVSIELPNDTEVDFVRRYYDGLCRALSKYDVSLFGGNLKASQRFSATGTILGREGMRRITRQISADDCDVFLLGQGGMFWAGVAAHVYDRIDTLRPEESAKLNQSILYPEPHIEIGCIISQMPFEVACMDCSDGPSNALYQLSLANKLNLIIPDQPEWTIPEYAKSILVELDIKIENACFNFGDWQLACLVAHENVDYFLRMLGHSVPVTWVGRARRGTGDVITSYGRRFSTQSLNENFRAGYNSVKSIAELVDRYLKTPVFR